MTPQEWQQHESHQRQKEGKSYRFAIILTLAIAVVFVLGMFAQGAGAF